MVYNLRVQGQVLGFGVAGKLRASDMVMHDRQGEGWWPQAPGQGIVGRMTGVHLTQLPAVMESRAQVPTSHPEGLVMVQPGWPRRYGANPCAG